MWNFLSLSIVDDGYNFYEITTLSKLRGGWYKTHTHTQELLRWLRWLTICLLSRTATERLTRLTHTDINNTSGSGLQRALFLLATPKLRPLRDVKVKVAHSCPTFCDLMDYTVDRILQAGILEWVAFPSLQGIFPTQESKLGLPHCRQILYQWTHKGSQWVVILESRISPAPTMILSTGDRKQVANDKSGVADGDTS